MAATWKTVRVFISSTFRDMHAERDHLIKVTFPRLRQWCEERRLHLVDIDLRWGVTKEEADNGEAIEICLQEIDGSRPFFVCILGNRYGWVPDNLPNEEKYRFKGLQQRTHCSITHLEIMHATEEPVPRLDGKQAATCPHAFFYFREERCLPKPEQVPADARKEYQQAFFEQLTPRADLLKALKGQIRDRYQEQGRVFDYQGVWDPEAENPEDDKLKGRLTGLDLFGDRVEADLKRAIKAQFAEHIAAIGDRDPFEDELGLHDAFIENRTQVHVPRSDVEEKLTVYVATDNSRPLVLSGPPGCGKSAVLAHWVRGRRGPEGQDREGEMLVARFVGASPTSTSVHGLLGHVCEALRRRFELTEEVEEEAGPPAGTGEQREKRRVTRPMQVPADPIEIQNKWPRFLEAAGAKGKVTIVLDAVNQLEKGADPRRAYWIPRKLPAGVHLILSALDHGEASQPLADGRPAGSPGDSAAPADWLAELRRRDIEEVKVPDLTDDDCIRIIRELPSVFCKSLDEGQARSLLKNQATRNPLFLTVALEELRVFGSFEQLPKAIGCLPHLDSPQIGGKIDVALDELFGQVLDRLDRESSRQASGMVPRLFSLLASSRDGLSEQELDGLLAQTLPQLSKENRQGGLQIVLRQVRPYLQRKQSHGAVLVDFYHRSFWKAVLGKYLKSEEARAATHVEIAEYFEKLDWFAESLEEQRARAKRLPPTPRPVTVRKVVELPWQRLEAAKLMGKDDAKSPYWDAVADLLTNWQFLEAKTEAEA